MDTQERHELKQNDLREFLLNFREWWSRYGHVTLLSILLVVLVALFVPWYRGRDARALEQAYAALDTATSPVALEDVARQYPNVPGVAALARLQAADLLVNEALLGGDMWGEALDEEERQQNLERAAEIYRHVIEMERATVLHQLNARLGLAAVYESLGDFDSAREQYRSVQEGAPQMLAALADQARQREADLDRISQPIAFVDREPADPQLLEQLEGTPSALPDLPPGLFDDPEALEDPESFDPPEEEQALPEPEAPQGQEVPPLEPEAGDPARPDGQVDG